MENMLHDHLKINEDVINGAISAFVNLLPEWLKSKISVFLDISSITPDLGILTA